MEIRPWSVPAARQISGDLSFSDYASSHYDAPFDGLIVERRNSKHVILSGRV